VKLDGGTLSALALDLGSGYLALAWSCPVIADARTRRVLPVFST
jgi:hypothetical protein